MNNIIQTSIITTKYPDELEDTLNSRLVPLGKNVQSVEVISGKGDEYVAMITYRSRDINAEIEQKVEELQGTFTNDPAEPIRVMVMFASEFEKIKDFLIAHKKVLNMIHEKMTYEDNHNEKMHSLKSIEKIEDLINKLEDVVTNSQED